MEYRTSDINQLVKIERCECDLEPITLIEFFNKTVDKYPDRDALAYRDSNGVWHKISYKEYKSRVERLAKVFIKLGLKQRGVVAILAWNCPEWMISALAAIHAGGVVTGIYTTNSSDACQYMLEKSKAQIVIVDNDVQLEKINRIKNNLSDLISVLETSKLSELLNSSIPDDIETEYHRRLTEIYPNECCAIIYTSGTTGFPKGAMLSHDNLIWLSVTLVKEIGTFEEGKESSISYLPLSHVAAFAVDIIMAIHVACTVHFTDSNALKGNFVNYLKEVQPTAIFAVPRVYEKIEEKFKENALKMNFIKRKLVSWAQSVNLEHYQAMQKTNVDPSSLKLAIARRFVSNPIKEALGFKRCRTFFTGSAPISQETKQFYMSLDMPLLDSYGMTETLVHTLQSISSKNQFGNIGKTISGAETKIFNKNEAGEGEICMKGRHVCMGYLNDYEKTVKAIDDEGFLHSGDIGFMDDEGLVYMRGRIKELIITSGGENIPAPLIENAVKIACPAISNAFLVGDNRKYLTMLISFKTKMNKDGNLMDELTGETLEWLESQGMNHQTLSELLNDKKNLHEALQVVIDKVNANAISNAQKIQKFAILPHDFSLVTGELTPTLKVKRNVVVEMYKNLIEELYS